MTIKTDNIQIGQNATATQNFVLKQGADGTCTLARGNVGATTQDVLTVDATGKVAMPNNTAIFTAYTESAPVAVTFPLTTPKTIAHGVGGIPKLYVVVIKCTTAEFGYSIGDEVPITNGQDLYTAGNWRTIADSTNITIIGTGSAISISNKSTGASQIATAANWSYVVRAWR